MNYQRNHLVSVIIPFLNAEKFLAETIESVIGQEYKFWELILIDDGSTDSSGEIVSHYITKYPGKIICVTHEGHANKGAAASRNLGIVHAKGEYLAFLDADDLWRPEKLSNQIALLSKNTQATMICESSDYWFSWNEPDHVDVNVPIGVPADKLYYPPSLAIQLYPLGKGAAPCPSSIIIKTATAKALGGFDESFTGNIQAFEDQAFLSKVYLNEIIYVSSGANNLYRQWKGSVMDVMISKGYYSEAMEFFLHWLRNYLDKHNIRNRKVNFLIAKAFLPFKFPFFFKTANRLALGGKKIVKKILGR